MAGLLAGVWHLGGPAGAWQAQRGQCKQAGRRGQGAGRSQAGGKAGRGQAVTRRNRIIYAETRTNTRLTRIIGGKNGGGGDIGGRPAGG